MARPALPCPPVAGARGGNTFVKPLATSCGKWELQFDFECTIGSCIDFDTNRVVPGRVAPQTERRLAAVYSLDGSQADRTHFRAPRTCTNSAITAYRWSWLSASSLSSISRWSGFSDFS